MAITQCSRCNHDFDEKELYWHNYERIGFFCRPCFNIIEEITGSKGRHVPLEEE